MVEYLECLQDMIASHQSMIDLLVEVSCYKNLTLRWCSRSGKGMGILSLYLYIRRLLFLYLKQKKKLVLH